jgi:hypothetical protein
MSLSRGTDAHHDRTAMKELQSKGEAGFYTHEHMKYFQEPHLEILLLRSSFICIGHKQSDSLSSQA